MESESDPEHALTELEAEQSTVGDTQGGAGCFGEVGGQHGLGAMPSPGAAAELPDVVEAGPCTANVPSFTFGYCRNGTVNQFFVLPTCIQVSHHIDTGSYGHCTIDKG